jgi:ABC-type arginine transport system permease subunit
MDEQREKLEAMEREKELMIRQYMELQNKAEEVNEQIYKVCCGVETLNVHIAALQEEIRRAAFKALPGNGKVSNGKVHPQTNLRPQKSLVERIIRQQVGKRLP